MLSLFSLIAWSYFIAAVHTSNPNGIQKITYEAALDCYHENPPAHWLTVPEGLFTDTAQCEFPVSIQHNRINYNYSVGHYDNTNNWTRYPLVIEFNETITRFSSEEPLKYVVSGDGIVRSQLLNGYRAKQLIKNLYDYVPDERELFYGLEPPAVPTICDDNGGYTQLTEASMYLVVYPQSLSEQSVNEIHTKLTFDNAVTNPVMDPKTFFKTTLNSTGMICFGHVYSHFTTSTAN